MTRSAARRGGIQAEKSPPAPPSSDHDSDNPQGTPAPASGVAWYWRLALFLWGTSYAFLMLYEFLAGIIKAF